MTPRTRDSLAWGDGGIKIFTMSDLHIADRTDNMATACDVADVGADHVGYEALMIACVTQAIEDYLDGPGDEAISSLTHSKKSHRRSRRKVYEEARHYVFDDTQESLENVFGFAFILMSLGIDPETARNSILRRTRCKNIKKEAVPLDPMYASTENDRHGESA